MARFYMKVLWFGLLLIFCIFFGVSLATSGIERIQGPISPGTLHTGAVKPIAANAVAPSPSTKPAAVKAKEPTEVEDQSLNFVGNKLGDLLQIVSHHGIQSFVSLFDSVLGK